MKQQTPFDTTELEREIEHECDFNNGSVGCKVCIKDERVRLKAEVERIIDDCNCDENYRIKVMQLKSKLFGK